MRLCHGLQHIRFPCPSLSLRLKSIVLMMPSNHLILYHPLLLLLSIFPNIRVFSNESVFCIRWPKCWSFSFSTSPSNEYSGLMSFRRDWLDLLAVQGTLKSLLHHHSLKASVLCPSAFSMVQLSHPYILLFLFSHSVVSDSLWPHGLQHATLPCPSPTPRACSHSCPSSQWCHPTISSSVIPFSSCFQSFPAPGSFPMSQFFASGGQSIGASASAAVFPMNIQDQFLLGWTGSISLLSKGLSRVFSSISSSALSRLHGLFAQFSSFAYREHDLLKSFSCFA